MKKIWVICVMAAVCFGLTEVVQAVRPVMFSGRSLEPFVSVSIKPDKLELGTILPKTSGSLPGKLEAHILANCPHQVRVSFEPFAHQRGRIPIRPEDMSLVVNGVNVPMAGKKVTIITSMKPTPAGGVDIPVDINFTLANALRYPPGLYEGNLIFTVMAAH